MTTSTAAAEIGAGAALEVVSVHGPAILEHDRMVVDHDHVVGAVVGQAVDGLGWRLASEELVEMGLGVGAAARLRTGRAGA